MAEYLIAMHPNGKPFAVFSEGAEHFDPEYSDTAAARVRSTVRDDKGFTRSWSDWAESLAGQSQVARGQNRWGLISHRNATLRRILTAAQDAWLPVQRT